MCLTHVIMLRLVYVAALRSSRPRRPHARLSQFSVHYTQLTPRKRLTHQLSILPPMSLYIFSFVCTGWLKRLASSVRRPGVIGSPGAWAFLFHHVAALEPSRQPPQRHRLGVSRAHRTRKRTMNFTSAVVPLRKMLTKYFQPGHFALTLSNGGTAITRPSDCTLATNNNRRESFRSPSLTA